MTNKENFRATLDNPNLQETLGRWLCWQFFCNQQELLQTFPPLQEIFEKIVSMHPGWAELLSGAYRSERKFLLIQKRTASPKWTRLGEVVRPGLISIDGIGDVREKELLLYRLIARESCTALARLFQANSMTR
jgi:hypothetical protein